MNDEDSKLFGIPADRALFVAGLALLVLGVGGIAERAVLLAAGPVLTSAARLAAHFWMPLVTAVLQLALGGLALAFRGRPDKIAPCVALGFFAAAYCLVAAFAGVASPIDRPMATAVLSVITWLLGFAATVLCLAAAIRLDGRLRRKIEPRVLAVVRHKLFFPFVCLMLVLLMNLVVTPDFFSVNITNGVLYGRVIDILNRSSELVILAVGMTIVVSCSAGTDISVGAVMAFSGSVSIWALGYGVMGVDGKYSIFSYSIPFFAGIAVALLVGGMCGLWNGFLVSKLKIQPMVATLILFTGGRGAAQLFAGGQIDRVEVPSYKWLGSFLPGVPVPTAIFLAVAVVAVTALALKFSALGLNIQSVGVNNKASRVIGLRSSRIVLLAYTFCGLCAGIAGLIATSRISAIDANNCGRNMELDAILAVALGGNSLGGGKFSLAGSVVGAVTIQALSTSLLTMRVTPDQLPVYKAIVVVIIVALQSPELSRYTRPLVGRVRAFLAPKARTEGAR